jgi:hypothetical protein
MIKYALACADGHCFESWFPDSVSFEKQTRRGLVACPECASTRVEKAIMAPAVLGAARPPEGAGPQAAPSEPLLDDRRARMRAALVEMRREIEANTDDVGAKFPEVARAMHLGDAPERAIRGRASLEDAKALIDDGVGVMPMPILADELN